MKLGMGIHTSALLVVLLLGLTPAWAGAAPEWPRQIPWPESYDSWGEGYVLSYPTGEWHTFTKLVPGGPTGLREVTYRKFLQSGQRIVWYVRVKAKDLKAGALSVHFKVAVVSSHGTRETEHLWESKKSDGYRDGAVDTWSIGDPKEVHGPVRWWGENQEPKSSEVASRTAFHIDYLIDNKQWKILFGSSKEAVLGRQLRQTIPKDIETLAAQFSVALRMGHAEKLTYLTHWDTVGSKGKAERLKEWCDVFAPSQSLPGAIGAHLDAPPQVSADQFTVKKRTFLAAKKAGGRWYVVGVQE